MKARQHKLAAKNALKGKWGIAIGVLFIYFIINSAVGFIPEDYYWLYILVSIFFVLPLSVGYSWFHLEVKRDPNPKIATLFSSFKDNYVRNLLTYVLVTVFITLWALLLLIPGIIKSLAYSMTFYILRDNPNMSSLQAITESRRLMNGKKKNLFFLCLSFLGWYIIPIVLIFGGLIPMSAGIENGGNDPYAMMLLCITSIIIGIIAAMAVSIYVMPYMATALAAFYDDFVNPKLDEPTQESELLEPKEQ